MFACTISSFGGPRSTFWFSGTWAPWNQQLQIFFWSWNVNFTGSNFQVLPSINMSVWCASASYHFLSSSSIEAMKNDAAIFSGGQSHSYWCSLATLRPIVSVTLSPSIFATQSYSAISVCKTDAIVKNSSQYWRRTRQAVGFKMGWLNDLDSSKADLQLRKDPPTM